MAWHGVNFSSTDLDGLVDCGGSILRTYARVLENIIYKVMTACWCLEICFLRIIYNGIYGNAYVPEDTHQESIIHSVRECR